MKTCQPTSLALLVAMLAYPSGAAAIAAFQDPAAAPAADEGSAMNQPMELPPEAPAPSPDQGPAKGRKADARDELVGLQFRDQEIKTLIDTISLWTGKVVIPKQTALSPIKITIVSDRKMPKSEALNLIFQAFRLNGLGVVETEDMILIDNLTELNTLQPAKVLGPDVDISDLPENGNIVIKVFRIKNTKASQVYERLGDSLPGYATLQVDNNSNQIILEGDIALAKRVQHLIDLLDQQAYVDVQTKTLRLKYQDAQTISGIITDLFSSRAPTGGASTPRQGGGQPQGQQNNRGRTPTAGGGGGAVEVGTSEQLVVTTLPTTNSLTIRAEPTIMHEIEKLISELDKPSSESSGQIYRLYDLKYTDPLKVQTVLQSLLEGGGGGGARRTTGGGAGGRSTGIQRVQGIGGGGGGEAGADVAIANIFRIEAYPDSNRLIVVSKTPDNFRWLDMLIEQIDQPLQAGMPRNIPLKHAGAVELAEILNALLAQSGSSATIRSPEEGLTGIDFNVASGGQNGTTNTNAFTSGNTNQAGAGGGSGGIQFPWQSGRAAGEAQTEVSALVGKSRVVPNAGQNSLLILAPPEIQDSLAKIVQDLDKPGRQVMIAVVLAEVQLGDDFQLGIKWGQDLNLTNGNNAIVVDPKFVGSKTDIFAPDLSTSELTFTASAQVILQALSEETTVRILQEPRVFTSDNKEAKFFQGQDVPFQSSSLSDLNTGGGVNATFDQIPVGIGLNVRPRITKDRNVNMQIEVLLSNVNNTSPVGVGGNPVIDRRQTNTSVTVKNGQTIVLSGIRKETENKIKSKVPLLGEVPVLDWVFASTSETKATTELLVFVTPTVVDNPDENDANYNKDERKRLRELEKPVAEMSKELIKSRNLRSDDETVLPGPTDPLAPIEAGQELPVAPAPAPAPAPPAAAAPEGSAPSKSADPAPATPK